MSELVAARCPDAVRGPRPFVRRLGVRLLVPCTTALLLTQCGPDDVQQRSEVTLLDLIETKRETCAVGNQCAHMEVSPEDVEACALAEATLYERMGPECMETLQRLWGCALEVYENKGCAGWTFDDSDFSACFEGDGECTP